MSNPGSTLSGLPFVGSLHDALAWLSGLCFIVCAGVWLSGSGILKPIGSVFNHIGSVEKGTRAQWASAIGAIFAAGGWVWIVFVWHYGAGVH